MGMSKTATYRIEITDQSGYRWQTEFPFRPTMANLRAWVEQFNKSVIEGHNKHLGACSLLSYARVVRQRGNFTVVDITV